ncbi:hypothetical protein DFR58_108120 [Anaerobacterium chartisolvens]|uniref:FAD-dependent protein C-terminal domain-containing protein n=1 Tax=Anaerobacterium chartisolvens TaxID=1297424 RepID=A0A369B7D8_9FIRM|nr:hypothetical protein [Anaerobacterium chartisolvens]RCX17225.1 hypothetical protein DFR58_108120 [Anaerobacterium chartisolvens]
MKFIIDNIRQSIDEDVASLKTLAAIKLGISPDEVKGFKIAKESVDARRKHSIAIVYSVIVETDAVLKTPNNRDIRILEQKKEEALIYGDKRMSNRPVIVGTGPAGLFAGLVLAQNGYCPVLIERGECVEKRTEIVSRYWEGGNLDTETNVQFGEGGAGTFSDGKLTTRINDARCDTVLEELYKSGAGEEILYKSKPHIGTDVLKRVVADMRRRIIGLGGEVRFKAKMTSLKHDGAKVSSVVINECEDLPADVVVLAIGHSARDTYDELLRSGIDFEQKPFSIGVRIEHPQDMINHAQYGKAASNARLGAADYQLFYKTGGRTVYSFCMCPGGLVVAAASEPDSIVTNGMSELARDRENANSALVVSVGPGDFGGAHPLAGVEFQRQWERLAFIHGGKNSSAPAQRLEDFINGRRGKKWGAVRPSYTGRVQMSDLNLCLPLFVTDAMKRSIGYFDDRLKGFGMGDAILTGVETRTSSPVRIPRNEALQTPRVMGIYPAGEGVGYAGGIVSAAVDGIRVAQQIMTTYRPIQK